MSLAQKAQTVREVLRSAYRPDDLPAQLIQPTNGRVVWLLDLLQQYGAEMKDAHIAALSNVISRGNGG